MTMPTPTPEQAVEAVTWLHKIRTKPGRWWVTAVLVALAAVGCIAVYKRGAAWVAEMEAQKAVKNPGAAARFEAIEAGQAAFQTEVRAEFRDTRQEIRELRADVRRAMRQAVAQTDVDDEAAARVADSLPFRGCAGCAEGAIPNSGVPAVLSPALPGGDGAGAADRGRVGKVGGR